MTQSPAISWHQASVTRSRRAATHGHASVVLWFTGLSGSGKSTLSHAVEEALFMQGCRTFVLDGDNVRHGLCSDLGFSEADRSENIRRISETAKLFVESGTIVLTAFISPFHDDRVRARQRFTDGDFIEIFCDSTLATCEERDVKGLYKRARAGEISDFTGISSPYQSPLHPELRIPTGELTIEASVSMILDFLIARGIIAERPSAGRAP